MSTQDIGYFLELPSYIIEQTLSRRKKKSRAYYRYKINGSEIIYIIEQQVKYRSTGLRIYK